MSARDTTLAALIRIHGTNTKAVQTKDLYC